MKSNERRARSIKKRHSIANLDDKIGLTIRSNLVRFKLILRYSEIEGSIIP